MSTLNIDDMVASLKTHEITLGGTTYVAKALSLAELVTIQEQYQAQDGVDDAALRALFDAVGYPTDELLELPVSVLLRVQTELFTSISAAVSKTPKKKKKN